MAANSQNPNKREISEARLLVRPSEARRMLGYGIERIYALLNSGELESFKNGRARYIITASIRSHIARRLSSGQGGDREGLCQKP